MVTRVLARLPQRLSPLRPLLAVSAARMRGGLWTAVTPGRSLAAAGVVLLAIAGYFLLY